MTPNRRIALASFLILFLELLLIRLIGTEIRIFAYLGNLLLLVMFVGAGLGMWMRRRVPLSLTAVLLFLVTAVVTTSYILRTPRFDVKLFSGISELLAPLSEAYVWQSIATMSKTGAVLGIFLTIGLLVIIGVAFVPLGNLLGRLFAVSHTPIRSYSVNVAASLLGMWTFQLFSLFELPPLLGLTLAVAGLLALADDRHDRTIILVSAIGIIALATPKVAYQPYEGPTTFWSPYQKLTLSLIHPREPHHARGYYLEVNNVGYMGLLNLDDEWRASASAMLSEKQEFNAEDLLYLDQYTLPFAFAREKDQILLIGAGAGNDAAGAIRAGAKTIDAVEIDPTILRIGKGYHPEKPYQDPRVNVTTDDGRAFMERTDERYDAIIMGLADSHTLSSALTNLRLDHYLYTKESLARAKELLRPDGVFILSFEVTRPWIGERLAKTMTDVFGTEPLMFEVRSNGAFGWGGYFFVAAKDPTLLPRILEEKPGLARFISARERFFPSSIINSSRPAADRPLGETMNALTDDWPYLYLDRPRLPAIHLATAAFLVMALAVMRKNLLKNVSLDLPMFFWGAAFLLFEFQNISKASLLFGLTWQTNMIVITAALTMILLANVAVSKKVLSERTAFIGLIGSLIVQLLIPLHTLNRWSGITKLLVGGTILNLPFFFGGVIFATWFSRSNNRSSAFASNLIGAAFGGLLEIFSFLTGIKSLLVLALALYTLGWMAARRRAVQ